MQQPERSRIAVVAVFGWLVLACNSAPAPIGESHGGAGGSSNPGQGGGQTSQGGAGGAGGAPVTITVPDAAVNVEDALADIILAPASGDANCGSTQSELQRKIADLLLVLDRSSSMTRAMDSSNTCDVQSTTCSQRWATIISSLSKVLTSSSNDLNWGLKFFSSPTTATGTGGRGGSTGGGSCHVSAGVEVPVGPGNASTIQDQINAAGNETSTPTRLAIDAAVAYLRTVNDGNSKYILLATDGEPNCAAGSSGTGTDDLAGTVTAIQNAVTAGYKVFVIGVGPEAANLTSFAEAGGTDKFYPALTPDELSTALSAIVGTVAAGCTYDLPSTPIAPDAVGVYIDKSAIPQSDSQGWSYASGSSTVININGTYCEDLKSGKTTLVEIFLPCKASDPIPSFIP